VGESDGQIITFTGTPPKREVRRGRDPEVARHDKVICDIPERLTLDAYAKRREDGQSPTFRLEKLHPDWIKQGCPASYTLAVVIPRWRKQVQNERDNAWKRYKKYRKTS